MSLNTISSNYEAIGLSDPRITGTADGSRTGSLAGDEAVERQDGGRTGDHRQPLDAAAERDTPATTSTPLPATDRGSILAFMRASRLAAPLLPASERHDAAAAPSSPQRAIAQMPAARYNDQSLYLLGKAAQQQGLIDVSQATLHAGIAGALLPADHSGATMLHFTGRDVAALTLACGTCADAVRGMRVDAAAGYLNGAIDPMHQQMRLRQVLDAVHVIQAAPPKPSAQDMKQELQALLGLPDKAFKKMSDAQIAAKYNQVMAALEAGGSHKIKFGKYNASFRVDDNGQITSCKVKKRGLFGGLFSAIGSFFGKFGKTLLAVCSFIPIPWIAIPARIVSGVIAVVDGVKSGNVLQVVAGVADAVVGGVGAVAGKAASGIAGGIANVAGKVRDAAHGAQAAISSFQQQSFGGFVNGVLQAASTVSGAFGDVFDGVADTMRDVQAWSNRVLIGEQVVVDIKNGRILEAIGNGAGLVDQVAGEFGADGVLRTAGQIGQIAGQGKDAADTVQALLRGDLQGALRSGADFATALDGVLGTGISAQFDVDGGWLGAAGKWIGHGTDLIRIGGHIGAGRIDLALDATSTLVGDMEWDVALGTVGGHLGLGRTQWDGLRVDVGRTIDVWTGIAGDGYRVVDLVASGDYDAAFAAGIALGNRTAGELGARNPLIDADAAWVATAGRLLGYGEQAIEIVGDTRRGSIEAALDRASHLFAAAGSDFGAGTGDVGGPVLAHLGAWAGFGGDGMRIAGHVRGQDYGRIAYGALELAIGLGGYIGDADTVAHGAEAAWADEARRRGGGVIEAGLEARDAIGSGDLAAIVRAAQALCDAVRAAAETPELAKAA